MNIRKTAIAVCCAALLLTGCAPKPRVDVDSTPLPSPTPVPEVEYTLAHHIQYWPEAAGYEDCDYAAVVELPEFSRAFTAGYNMNNAVQGYLDDLFERVENIYMEAAVATPPSTEVACEVSRVGTYTNVVFTETHCYEAQPTVETFVLILDETGLEVSLCEVYESYHAHEQAAQAISEQYPDADINAILAEVDIRNGARLTETGCIVFLPEGRFAPYELGELAVEIPSSAFCPDCIDGILNEDGYRLLNRSLGHIVSAAIVREEEFDGAPSEYVATAFMGDLVLDMGLMPAAGRISVPAEEFESLYRECFGTDFPGIDADAHDITLSDSVYSVSTENQPYAYGIDVTAMERTEDGLCVWGDVIFGNAGYAYTTYICHAAIELAPNAESPFGYTIISLKFSF